jgi:hypothetical protein
MGWRGQHNRDLANERDFKSRPWRERNIFGRVSFVIAVVLFFAVWTVASNM